MEFAASEMGFWGVPDAGLGAALFGGASVFVAYEGFQLLTYDYDDIENPRTTLPRALSAAAALVALVVRLVDTDPVALAFLAFLVAVAIVGRPILLRHLRTESR